MKVYCRLTDYPLASYCKISLAKRNLKKYHKNIIKKEKRKKSE